jgi:malate dehydrogenase (oxaloacetate-decarboxylating)(NADP+)
MLNGLKVVGKKIDEVKVVCSGAGAAAIACLDLLVRTRRQAREHHVCDSKGVIYVGRPGGMDETKARYAQKPTSARWPMPWSAPTSSSACPPPAWSSRTWSRAWRPSR